MRQWLIHAALTTTLLLLFCIWFPATSSVAAYVVQSAPIFGAAFVLSFLISRQVVSFWWGEHVQLRGVGGKSGWQRRQRQNQNQNKEHNP